LAQRAIGVIAQSLGIGDGGQKEIEGAGLMAELIDAMLTHQALIYPAELAGHAPEFGRQNGAFVHRDGLLVGGVNPREYRAPIVAGGGW